MVWSGGVDPDDLAQGRLGNCYFLAFIAACALEDQDALLMDLFVEEHADVGMFGITFFVNGKWVTVVIDDRIPCVRQGRDWIPIFAGPKARDRGVARKSSGLCFLRRLGPNYICRMRRQRADWGGCDQLPDWGYHHKRCP